MRDKIFTDASVYDFYHRWAKDAGPFLTFRDLFLFAMAVGLRSNVYIPLSRRQEIANTTALDSKRDYPLLYLCQLDRGASIDELDLDEALAHAECFSFGGMQTLQESLRGTADDILTLVRQVQAV